MELTGLDEDRENRVLILRGVHDGVQVQEVDPAHRMDLSVFSKLRLNEKQNKVRKILIYQHNLEQMENKLTYYVLSIVPLM